MNAEPLWTRAAFEAAITGEVRRLDRDITGISIDSRTVAGGDAFFAIAGERFDGHDFVEAALDAGAACAVVSRRIGDGDRQVLVDDVLEALRELARAARARTSATVIGVTGSVGKTSTKEMLRTVLGSIGPVHAANASFNNHWGVPLTLARMPANVAFAVCEIGMNHAGEIVPLTGMVRPHIAIITTVEAVHIEFFDSVAAIADAKAEIFEGLEPGGTAIINRDNAFYDRLAAHAEARGAGRIMAFGRADEADARLLEVMATPEGSRLLFSIDGEQASADTGLRGEHMAINAIAALAAAKVAGAEVTKAAEALLSVKPAKGRGSRTLVPIAEGELLLIDESYNANPTSVRAALTVLGRESGRRIAALGDMLELGPHAAELHADLAEDVRRSADAVYLCGPDMRSLHETLGERSIWATDAPALAPLLLSDLAPGDVVMVKGSAGSRMGLVAEAVATLAQRG